MFFLVSCRAPERRNEKIVALLVLHPGGVEMEARDDYGLRKLCLVKDCSCGPLPILYPLPFYTCPDCADRVCYAFIDSQGIQL